MVAIRLLTALFSVNVALLLPCAGHAATPQLVHHYVAPQEARGLVVRLLAPRLAREQRPSDHRHVLVQRGLVQRAFAGHAFMVGRSWALEHEIVIV